MNKISKQIIDCFKRGNKLMLCGNGGSAAMSQEMAAELLCTFEIKDRPPLPAIALTTDTSIITAWSNDFDFEDVYARQVQALGKKGDILISFSTSGKSKNCLKAMRLAKLIGITVIDFSRKGSSTASIQEYQHKLMHQVCREVEKEMFT